MGGGGGGCEVSVTVKSAQKNNNKKTKLPGRGVDSKVREIARDVSEKKL